MTAVAYIALGSNLGDRAQHLTNARSALGALTSTLMVAESSVEETAPIGPPGQGAFLNQIVALETGLSPRELLAALHTIERAGGRLRRERWGARTIDLDIVCIDGLVVNEPDLVVPHPELPNRDFWQRELDDVRSRLRRGAREKLTAALRPAVAVAVVLWLPSAIPLG